MVMKIMKKRRREAKTDYALRVGLLKSNSPKIVIRKTNKYILVQVVESHLAQDKVSVGITSKELLKYGWDKKMSGSLKSIVAGYLTGYVAAKKIGKGKFIIDLGMAISKKGGRLSAVVLGLKDGGLDISANEEFFSNKESILNNEKFKHTIKKIIDGAEKDTKKITKKKKIENDK